MGVGNQSRVHLNRRCSLMLDSHQRLAATVGGDGRRSLTLVVRRETLAMHREHRSGRTGKECCEEHRDDHVA